MCLHYLVKLIARVLSLYITYFSIQVVDFWHQVFTICWNNSFQQSTTVSVVFIYIHYIIFANDDVSVTVLGIFHLPAVWSASSQSSSSSNQVCGRPIVLILTPSTMWYGESCRRGSTTRGRLQMLKNFASASWTGGNVLISVFSTAQWRSGENDCERVLLLKENSLNMNCDSWCNSVDATVHYDFAI